MKTKPTKKQIEEQRIERVKEMLCKRLSKKTGGNLAKQLIRGAEGALELDDFEIWSTQRLEPQLVWLDNNDYTRAITRALPQALRFAPTDFGKPRQRDLGQLWTDTARGFLGEIGFQKFLFEKFEKRVELDTTMDKTVEEYILSDLKCVVESDGTKRPPRIKVSVKAGKFNARWLDEYGAKKARVVDVFVFVRVGTVREHFVAFLKAISFLRDKLFPLAEQLGELTKEGSEELWRTIPEFEPVPAYITGYLERGGITLPIHEVTFRVPKKGQKKIIITQGVGVFSKHTLRAVPEIKRCDPDEKFPLVIDGIKKTLDEHDHFFAHTGSLKYGAEPWRKLVERL